MGDRDFSGDSDRAVFKKHLKQFYELADPEKLGNINGIVEKHFHRRAQLISFLEKKYALPFPKVSRVHGPTISVDSASGRAYISNFTTTGTTKLRSARCPQPSLDVYSECFDPTKALRSPFIDLPHPDIPIFDGIHKLRVLLPPDHPDFEGRVLLKKKTVVRSQTAKLRDEALKAMGPSLPERLASKYSTGPLSLLRSCMVENARVRIWMRRLAGLKGTVTGYILAFDKHMNIVLSDVDEDFIVCSGYDEQSRPKLKPRHRHFSQLIIRGDNVVLVAKTL